MVTVDIVTHRFVRYDDASVLHSGPQYFQTANDSE